MSISQQIVDNLLSRFPEAGSRTLARKAYADNKSVFSTLNAAYLAVRRARGSQGKLSRDQASDKTKFGTTPESTGFEAMPEGLVEINDWGNFPVTGEYRCGLLSDIHIPFHDRNALVIALTHLKRSDCNLIVLNGDICDHFSISRWEKDPRRKNYPAEIKAIRDFLEMLRKAFPKARIILKDGNHEERFESYMFVKAPELLGLAEFEMTSLLWLDKFGIEHVGDKRPIKLGELNVVHGHEFKFPIAGPVNPARGLFMKSKCHCIGGHFHQSSQHSEKNIEQNVVSTWSTGCLLGLHPKYFPINQWNHGFAIVETDRKGAFRVHNHRIVDNQVW